MNHHPQPPQPPPTPPINHSTTTQVLKHSANILASHVLIFFFLTSLVFVFRSNVDHGREYLTSFIDRDPSLKSVLSRLDISGRNHFQHQQHHLLRHHRRRRPFLHLSRVGTLDDDFFSGDEDSQRTSLFGSAPKFQPNGTLIILNPGLGFSDRIVDNGIAIPEIVRSGISFKAPERLVYSSPDEERNETHSGSSDGENESEVGSERILDLQIFVRGLELGRSDATTLLFLIGILSAAYGYVILAFLVTYAWVLGIAFVAVVNDLLGKYRSLWGTIWDGSNLGLKRLCGFILMKWAVRDALIQLLGIWFFGEIEDQYSFFKIFVRLKLMPFSVTTPWVIGYERESAGFLLSWLLLDTVVALIFAVDAWVAIADSRKSGREVVKEGCHLLSTMLGPAINLICLEGIICGLMSKHVLSRLLGKFSALAFQSAMEVYFLVAWLLFYFATRYKDATTLGRTFGQRELEGFLEGLR